MLIGVAVDGLAFLVLSRYLMPRLTLAILAVVGTIGLTATRWLSRYLARRRLGPARTLLVGSPAECASAVGHLDDSDTHVVVVGTVALDGTLSDAVYRHGATDVLLLGTSSYADIFPEPFGSLEAAGVDVFQRVNAAQTLLGLGSLPRARRHAVRRAAPAPFRATSTR